MYIFVPAQYGESDPWHTPNQPHFRAHSTLMFDEILNRAQMFDQAEAETLILLLNYVPHLRLTLNDYRMNGVNYLSFFDWLQGYEGELSHPIQLEELSWPAQAEFVYGPYYLLVNVAGVLYAKVFYSHQGTIIYIDFYEQDILQKRVYLDDRGYYSMVETFQDNQPERRVYYNRVGEIVLSHNLLSGACELKKFSLPQGFSRQYRQLEDLIQAFINFLMTEQIESEDVLVVGSHPQHNHLFIPYCLNNHIVFSFSSYDPKTIDNFSAFGQISHPLFIVDSQLLQERLLGQAKNYSEIIHQNNFIQIPPFDSRFNLGKSSQIRNNILNLVVDDMSQHSFEELLTLLKEWLPAQKNYVLNFVTFKVNSTFEDLIRQWSEDLLAENQDDDQLIPEEEEEMIHWYQIRDEAEFIRLMSEARLLIDLSDLPNGYVQMAGISVGIPQINKQRSQYIQHLKNGYIIHKTNELPQAISYFTENLDHWNQALIYNVQLIEANSGQQLVPYLKQRFKEHFHDNTD